MKQLIKTILFAAFIFTLMQIPAAAAEKDWTFMVFINADNNLDEYGVEDQEEMAAVGADDMLNIVTLIDRYDAPATLNYIEKGHIVKLSDEGELDMGDWHELVRFAETAAQRFPARHYALVVWNHGSGWKMKNQAPLRGISYDDSSNNHMTTAEMGLAMREISAFLGRKIDLLCMDACLMQMFETAWPLRNSCDYILASEETVPGEGFPYADMLKTLKPQMSPKDFGAAMVAAFRNYYAKDVPQESPWDITQNALPTARVIRRTTLSLLDTARLFDLQKSLDKICDIIISGNYTAALKKAYKATEHFSYYDNIDLKDLFDTLQMNLNDSKLKPAIAEFNENFKRAVIANGVTGMKDDDTEGNGDSSDDFTAEQHARSIAPICANGIAVYFPEKVSSYLPEYDELEFCNDSRWNEMLHDYFRKTAALDVVSDLSKGNLDALRGQTTLKGPLAAEIKAATTDAAAFKLYTEGGLPAVLMPEAESVIETLRVK